MHTKRDIGKSMNLYDFSKKISNLKNNSSQIIIDSYKDHRIAMSFAIAGILCGISVEDTACIDTSFPNFFDILNNITQIN